jgi:hypothetical protein
MPSLGPSSQDAGLLPAWPRSTLIGLGTVSAGSAGRCGVVETRLGEPKHVLDTPLVEPF